MTKTFYFKMTAQPVLNKIPGILSAPKSDHYIEDLSKLDMLQLLDIKAREQKLLSRKNLNKLPDHGQRIKDFYKKVCNELRRRSDIDDAAEKFSQMNIVSKGLEKLVDLEWNGKFNNDAIDLIDSEDKTELDPLEIMSQLMLKEKKFINVPLEETLITPKDIEEINSFKIEYIDAIEKPDRLEPLPGIKQINPEEQSDHHLQYLVAKGVDRLSNKKKFKPFQTTISNVHDPEKEKDRKIGTNWENTAATPPLLKHGAVKMLSLADSVEIQKGYLEKLKMLQEKQAAERLQAKLKRAAKNSLEMPSGIARKDIPLFNNYRDNKIQQVNIEGFQHISEEDEVKDLDDEKCGGVVFRIIE